MESKWLAMVLLALLMFAVGWTEGCLEEESVALFRLKPFFPFIDYKTIDLGLDLDYSVDANGNGSGEEKEGSPDCCEWERVECNPITGRVTHLFLNLTYTAALDEDVVTESNLNIFISWRNERGPWYLNASLFLPFQELQSLSLSGNFIAGCVVGQGFESLSSELDKLEILDLSSNFFNDSILASLSELSSLKSLNLAENWFTGTNSKDGIKMLSKLKNLETLDLSSNSLGNNILSQLAGFTSLKSLRLQDCGLKGSIDMSEVGNLRNLKELYVVENEIQSLGSVFHGNSSGLARLNKLEVLGLSYNLFNNSIFSSLDFCNLINLRKLLLGGNEIERLEPSFQGKQELRLIKLEVLALDNNLFNNNIFSSLTASALPNLKFLYLDANRLNGPMHVEDLNALRNLEELTLSDNEVTECAPSEELRLMNLKVLDLSDNSFNKSIFPCLGSLPNLKTLRIESFNFKGPIDIKDGLSNLEELYMSCYSDCSLPLESLGLFSSLKTLSLRGFNFNATTMTSRSHNKWEIWTNLEKLVIYGSSLPLHFLGSLSSLKILHLSPYDVNDNIFMSDFCELRNLQELLISGNGLKGSLPMCFSNLTFLEKLDLSFNELSGDISALQGLASLQWLDLSNNEFQIPSSLGPLFNLSKLKYIRADNNIIYADDEMYSSAPTFQLNYITLSCCGSGGTFPPFLHHQHELVSVTLSHIHFKLNQFPFWLLQNNTKLGSLHLVNCTLSGPFQLPFHWNSVLSDLDISNNFFTGSIPTQIGEYLPSLNTLNMSKNYFNGSIPFSFGDMSSLQSLDLSNNQLSGGVPEHLAMGCSSLGFLALSNNTLQGTIFSGNFSLTWLSVLKLDGNHFSGKVPSVLSNCSYLYKLDLSNNYLFGEIPSWILSMSMLSELDISRNQLFGRIPQWRGNTSSLEQIAMADNRLEGSIPRAFCNLNLRLQFLDLSMNNISGTLPSCFKPSGIEEVHLFRNMLQGPLPNAFRDSSLLVTLDLSYNHFSGNIPNWISNLSQLSYLLLKRNHFQGEIPIQLCLLAHLSMIDLSQNNLSGSIPSCLKVTALNNESDHYSWISFNYLGINSSISMEEPIEYTIKSRSYTYKKKLLQYMSGIDLSCNKLTGEIPHEVQSILMIFTMNLSHNSLTGPIPRAFSNLRDIESLDLSYNNLTGNIPPEFAMLHFLQYMNVSYNKLSGKTPERIGQLGAFDESSYVGNPFLCGSLVGRNCSAIAPPLTPKASAGNTEEDLGLIDMDAFYGSFVACYIVAVLCIAGFTLTGPRPRSRNHSVLSIVKAAMEVGSFSPAEKRIWVCSVMEALLAETLVLAGKSLVCLLMLTGSVLNDMNASLNLTAMDQRFPFDELLKEEHPGPENKDGSDTEDDDEDEEEDNVDDQDDDGDDEDFSAEEGEEGDPEDDPEANGNGGSGEEDDEDDDGDDDAEDEEEEDEEDEDDEVPQPPSKKRK
ncbi:hypothetical protein V6N11_057402 [Hibiscus sabdariffa]|uniref:Leucine-rich repeat-containing N-terminal plant-type domain-containing protein n=1 Tax=Hibiscus sabdariffa TaxID=183260 RepID=A0ABR2N9S4_9ROSI